MALGADHAEVGRTQAELVEVLRAEEKYEEAWTLARLVVQLRERQQGTDHPATATALFSLASLLEEANGSKDLFEDPEPIYRRCAAIRSKASELTAPSLCCRHGSERRENVRRAPSPPFPLPPQSVSRTQALGPEHADVAAPLDGLVRLLYNRERYADGEVICRRR